MLSDAQTGVKHVALTMGNQGAALCTISSCGRKVVAQHVPAVPASIVNTSGAGDCLVAGTLARLVQGATPSGALAFGVVSIAFCVPNITPAFVVLADCVPMQTLGFTAAHVQKQEMVHDCHSGR